MRRSVVWKALVRMLLLLPVPLAGFGCGGKDKTSTPGDGEAPTVVAFSLADSATGIGLVTPITVTFSGDMDEASVVTGAIVLEGRPAGGHVRYDALTRSATFTPDTLYLPETWQRLSVSGATDLDGNAVLPAQLRFRTGPLDCVHLADPHEPNEEIAAAAWLEAGGVYRSLTVCEQEIDTYAFTLADPADITAATTVRHAHADAAGYAGWQIHFMNANRQYYATLGTSAVPGEHTYHYSFLPGTYYLEIFSSYGVDPGEFVLYDLELRVGEPCEDDAYEDNDFPHEASLIAPGVHTGLRGCHVDADYYRVAVRAGETLALTVDATVPAGAWAHRRVELAVPGASTVTYSGSENPVAVQAIAARDGEAVVCVRFWVDGVAYSMEVQVTASP